jgi:uroporphyrinogen decarboxylase
LQPRMSDKERLAALLRRQTTDRVPLFLASLGFSLRNMGHPVARAYDDPETSFLAQVRTNEMYGAIPLARFVGGAFGAREFGGEVRMPEEDIEMAPSLLHPPITSEADVERLEQNPPDVRFAGSVPLYMIFSRLQATHGLPVTFFAGGVLTMGGNMCGVERMCRWMLKAPSLLHRVCRLATDFILTKMRYWVETFGAGQVLGWNTAATESNQIISPRQFQAFALPYQREIYRLGQTLGIPHFYTHICGEQNANLPYWAQISHGDPGLISFGPEICIETVSRSFPKDVLLGNVSPTSIQLSTQEEIRRTAVACIKIGRRHPGGFVLAPGCELPVTAPPENVRALRQAVEEADVF